MSHGIRPTGHKVRIKEEKCVACGRCEKVCARNNFGRRADGKWEVRDAGNCNGCRRCREACLTNAIAVAPQPLPPFEPRRRTAVSLRPDDGHPGC